MKKDLYFPGQAALDLKAEFARLLHFISARRGWITSVPGAEEVTIEVLPDSTIPEELRSMGYRPQPDGTGERILPNAIVEPVVTEGSTVPMMVTHAGIVTVERWSFSIA